MQPSHHWTVERLQELIIERSADGSAAQHKTASRLLKPVVYETLFVFVLTNGPDGSCGVALAEKWSFVLTKHSKHKSTSSHQTSNHSGGQLPSGI